MQTDLQCLSPFARTFLVALIFWETSLHSFANAYQGHCRSLKFTTPTEGHSLNGHMIKNLSIRMPTSCKNLCTIESKCVSFNIGPPINGKMVCELSDSDHSEHPADLKPKKGFTYTATENHCLINPCYNNGTCLNGFTDKKYLCKCSPGYGGDNCERGWTMIFKVVGSDPSPKVGHLWNSSTTQLENVTGAQDTNAKNPGHLKNHVVLNWQTFNPQEARVVLYQNGQEVASLRFNATGTNNLDWFSQTRLITSTWNDLTTDTQLLKFAIFGFFSRFFEISQSYGGCTSDIGWFVVVHTGCDWETRVPVRSILFSKLSTAVNWNNYGNVGIADVLAVFVR